MKRPFGHLPQPTLRLLVVLLLFIGFALLLILLLMLTESIFSVWELISEQPAWFLFLYVGGLVLFSSLFMRFVWRILRPKSHIERRGVRNEPLSLAQLDQEISTASQQGVDTKAAVVELQTLQQRRDSEEIYIALFGAVSMGKSALINALLPEAGAITNPCSGTTQTVDSYQWQSAEKHFTLVDMPGLFEPDGRYSRISQEEAKRAHLVLYLCDGDLTREQFKELEELLAWQKPLALLLNKIDRYRPEELEMIQQRLRQHLSQRSEQVEVIPVQCGGEQEVIRINAAGEEETVIRQRPTKIDQLREFIAQISTQSEQLHQSRDHGLLRLGEEKLATARTEHQQQESEQIIKSYTKRAIVGALAAVTPGTDLLIQGYLGVQLIKALSKLYDVPLQDVEADRFIKIISRHVGKSLPLMLAVAGNVCKSFPGIGTLTGSLLHAVAYGLIFESLGRSVAETLRSHGSLDTHHAIDLFEENLGENMEQSARKHAQLVFDEIKKGGLQRSRE